jgi:hypothetical protein
MPYPAEAARREYAVGDLLDEQDAAVAAFAAIVTAARAAIAAIEFPLGSPARGYDLIDIDGSLCRLADRAPGQ